ncbi:putative glutathione-dependent formaldehyde-activating enzyme protein [Diplogelasinospora grovesii]|uniref:Glutathione-dependent formaldehyde-activating enzyme protein n=1 Tax=Diplogelasinospora grovesii TaxID=303347 RepID=A0AAN6N0D8_9PEZI|nr:putative glutathione-dependent formaldehyde-activating enzyme protein [Diplogelasinospora grovesii]
MKIECQCGSVSFQTPTPAPIAYHCHCPECQKQSARLYFPLSADLQAKLRCWPRPTKEGRTMDCYVRVMHRIRDSEADGQERPTVSIKGVKLVYVRSAVVPIPGGADRFETTPPVMEGRP